MVYKAPRMSSTQSVSMLRCLPMLLSLPTGYLDTFKSYAVSPAAFLLANTMVSSYLSPKSPPTPTAPGAIGLLLEGGCIPEAGLSSDSPIELLLLREAGSFQ